MQPSEFRKAWTEVEDNLRPISLDTLNKFGLNEEVIDFLNISGLPDSAAPFLDFVGDWNTRDQYSMINKLPDLFNIPDSSYDKYIVIGSDGSGNCIACDTSKNCMIEWLDHEDYFSAEFMNSSIGQLANCLLVYRAFILSVNESGSKGDGSDAVFSDAQYDILKDMLESIDERAVKEGFWKEELEILLANREDESGR